MEITTNVEVTYKATDKPKEVKQWLQNLPETVALDFETASKYSPKQKEELNSLINDPKSSNLTFEEIRCIKQKIESDGLSHPSLSRITHLVIGISESESLIVIVDDEEVHRILMEWLVTTDTHQIWHNAGFDFRHIYYHTKKFPKNAEDTQILAKTIVNHVLDTKSNTRLKHLMGHRYGKWAVHPDLFVSTNLYDPVLLKYAAYDGAATLALWNSIQKYLKEKQ